MYTKHETFTRCFMFLFGNIFEIQNEPSTYSIVQGSPTHLSGLMQLVATTLDGGDPESHLQVY